MAQELFKYIDYTPLILRIQMMNLESEIQCLKMTFGILNI